MELNAEERRNRKFILVQLPETPDKNQKHIKPVTKPSATSVKNASAAPARKSKKKQGRTLIMASAASGWTLPI